MKLADIKKVDKSKLPNKDWKDLYDEIYNGTDGFSNDYLELYETEIKEFYELVKKNLPDAIKEKVVKKREPKPKKPVIEFDADDVVEQVMADYNLTKEKAQNLIELRKEAYELKKENIEKLLDRLDKSEFYQGKNYISKAPIDKGRGRDIAKDSKTGSITEAEERKMSGTKFKRISKAGRKNQYGTTEGGKVYYEYRMNRRDVDNSIKLAKGGGVNIPNADKMFHLPYELAIYVPSTKDVDKNITSAELRSRVKEVEKYLAETFGGFTSAEKVGGYLSSKSAVVTEKVIPVTAFATMESFRANKSKLINKMSVWAKMWGQEAIGFEFEGDLYYVPQKFKTGGKLKATYIPKRDIKTLTTIWGNNIKGKDLIDGAYTTRKDLKTEPKVARTQFEEETFEFAKGGKTKKPQVVRYYFEDEAYEYAEGGGVPRKDFLLSNTEAPVPVYTYLPNVKRELHEDLWQFIRNPKNEGLTQEYFEKALRLSVNGKYYYDIAINTVAKGYPLILQQAIRCKKYLENIGYKVAIGENFMSNMRQLQEGYFNVYTDKKIPESLWKEMDKLGIASFKPYSAPIFPTLFAQGGMLEHGLQIGDKVIDYDNKSDSIMVENNGINYVVHLPTGKRRTSFKVSIADINE